MAIGREVIALTVFALPAPNRVEVLFNRGCDCALLFSVTEHRLTNALLGYYAVANNFRS